MVIGITGGVGSGKSTFCKSLQRSLPEGRTECVDTDQLAREVLARPEMERKVLEMFGAERVGAAGGGIDRARLRELVFAEEDARRKLEALLHPVIREAWRDAARARRGRRGEWFLVEVPLLYEVGAEGEFDQIVVVACSLAAQRARIEMGRGLSAEIAERMIAAQEPLAAKAARARTVVWSEGPLARLEEQAKIFADYLNER